MVKAVKVLLRLAERALDDARIEQGACAARIASFSGRPRSFRRRRPGAWRPRTPRPAGHRPATLAAPPQAAREGERRRHRDQRARCRAGHGHDPGHSRRTRTTRPGSGRLPPGRGHAAIARTAMLAVGLKPPPWAWSDGKWGISRMAAAWRWRARRRCRRSRLPGGDCVRPAGAGRGCRRRAQGQRRPPAGRPAPGALPLRFARAARTIGACDARWGRCPPVRHVPGAHRGGIVAALFAGLHPLPWRALALRLETSCARLPRPRR